jgi:hypothetical protein
MSQDFCFDPINERLVVLAFIKGNWYVPAYCFAAHFFAADFPFNLVAFAL